MLNRLKQMKLHYEQLAEKIASPEVMADMNAWRELVKEHSTLEPIITAYDEYLETERGDARFGRNRAGDANPCGRGACGAFP